MQVYEANVPDNFRRPQTDSALESFIRAKYEQKKYIAKEWVQTPVPKVDWEKEMEEELDKQKKKKKVPTNANTPVAIPAPSSEKKSSTPSASKTASIPPPLSKPLNTKYNSPRSSRERKSSGSSASSDLLGLNNSNNVEPKASVVDNGETFANFLSISPAVKAPTENHVATSEKEKGDGFSSLDKEEADFFNQTPADKEKSAKLTKDSIMALYGSAPTIPAINPLNNFHNFNGTGGFGAVPAMPAQLGGFCAPPTAFMPVNAPQPFQVANQFGAQNTIVSPQPQQQQFIQQPVNNQWMLPNAMMGNVVAAPGMFNYQPTSLPNVAPAASVDPIAKQFGSLNLNNVWQ